MWEETVDCISREALEAVIAAIYHSYSGEEREMLLPTTLAQVSPRVFWSLVWLYHDDPDIVTIEQCLSTLMPHLDWSFLHKRKRVLSEKAMENKRQQQQHNDDDNEEAAQEAVRAVESAMEQQLENYHANQEERRERAARAALSRHEANETTTTVQKQEWKLVTPTERDDEELQECIATTTTTNGNHHQDVSTILAALHSLDIYNWRQLANARAETIRQATNVSQNVVERWMDYAQVQSLEEMIVEICNGNVNAVQVLRDEARTGTIQDLSLWKNMPDLLCSSAPSLALMGVGVEEVRTWCRRAQNVMEKWEWVQWYATPVE
mmetsp:Transcript_27499/g.49741  ORF Transcript_27499/g.49741 Transcript_27499/m.49741 type:complete len:322 (+) Transcript_27499:178-1143(+)